MSIDEGDLRASLSTALDDLDYGPLPLSSVISRGRTVVLRRRLTAAAGALAVAIAAIPVIAHQVGQTARPATSTHYQVTVRPPGAKSPRGLIAYVRLNHRHWQITGSAERVSGRMNVCFEIFGDDCQISPIPLARDKGVPADFDMSAGPAPLALIADVRSDVRFLQVSLSNGQIVTLKPVAIFGPSCTLRTPRRSWCLRSRRAASSSSASPRRRRMRRPTGSPTRPAGKFSPPARSGTTGVKRARPCGCLAW